MEHLHPKTNLNILRTRHNCDKCTRSYTSSTNLTRNKRIEHATVKPQFIYDYCGHKANEKSNLLKHISWLHS